MSRFGATASVLAVALSFAFGAAVTYVTSYQPLIRLERRHRSRLVDIVLRHLVIVYRDQIADCEVRANVMLADRSKRWPSISSPTVLSIAYSTGEYSEWEESIGYRTGEGTVGVAFHERDIAIYDSNIRNRYERRMTVEQRVATDHVESAISVPIFPQGDPSRKPMGVLTFDSIEHVGKTKFNNEASRTLLVKYATALGTVLE